MSAQGPWRKDLILLTGIKTRELSSIFLQLSGQNYMCGSMLWVLIILYHVLDAQHSCWFTVLLEPQPDLLGSVLGV